MSRSSKFPKKWFWRRIKSLFNLFKELAVLSFHERTLSSFGKCSEHFSNDARVLSLKSYFMLTLLENKRSAVIGATTYFAFSLP